MNCVMVVEVVERLVAGGWWLVVLSTKPAPRRLLSTAISPVSSRHISPFPPYSRQQDQNFEIPVQVRGPSLTI